MAKQTLLSAFFQPPRGNSLSRSDEIDGKDATKTSKRKRRQIIAPSSLSQVQVTDSHSGDDIKSVISSDVKPKVDDAVMTQQLGRGGEISVTLSPTSPAPALVLDENMIKSTSENGRADECDDNPSSSSKKILDIQSNFVETARVPLPNNYKDDKERNTGSFQNGADECDDNLSSAASSPKEKLNSQSNLVETARVPLPNNYQDDQERSTGSFQNGADECDNNPSSSAASPSKKKLNVQSNLEETVYVPLPNNYKDDQEGNENTGTFQANEGISEYEKLRLRNIKRNHERLVALGLADPMSDPLNPLMGRNGNGTNEGRHTSKSKSKKRRRAQNGAGNGIAQSTMTPTVPLRRSTRKRGMKVPDQGSALDDVIDSTEMHVEKEAEQEQEQFKDSPLVQYEITSSSTSHSKIELEEKKPGKISSLVPYGQRLLSPKANHAIYSLDIFKASSLCSGNGDDGHDSLYNSASSNIDWIVGAGKSGIISIWNHLSMHKNTSESKSCDMVISSGTSHEAEENEQEHTGSEPIISWKGHGGRWIADARFVPAFGESGSNRIYSQPSHLLTAANDGCVCLWDVRSISCQTGAPKCVSTTSKTLHRGGIFSMDVSACTGNSNEIHVCTGSKDKTVAVTTLESITHGKACKPLFVSHHHSAKVGCVAMQQLQLNSGFRSNLIGSTSDDGLVAIHDVRCKTVVNSMTNAHKKPHSIVWHPNKEHLFMTGKL